MNRYRLVTTCLLLASALTSPRGHAVIVPPTLSFGGELKSPDGSPLAASNVNFRIQVYDAAQTCVLYSEEHLAENLNLTLGRFNLLLGQGTSIVNNVGAAGKLDVTVFANPGATPVAGCGARSSVALNPGDGRLISVAFDIGSGYTPLTPSVPLTSSAYAMVAETLAGHAATDFIQANGTGALNQANEEYAFSLTNWPRLKALLDGTSSQYLPSSPTVPLDVNGQRITDLADPTAAQDAATKHYVDQNLGGSALDLTAVGPMTGAGSTLLWDATANKWVAGTLSTTPTGAAGGDLTGTYPNPTVANDKITSAKINSTGVAVNRLLMTDATTGATIGYGACATAGQVFAWTATGWACASVSSLAPVTSVAGKTGVVSLNAADVGGLGTAALYDYGTAAGQIPRLDGAARLPAVDGSLLANVNAVRLQSRAIAATTPTDGQVLGWNQASSQWQPVAAASGTLTNIASGTGLLGGSITTAGTLSVNVGTAAGQIPQLNANAQLALRPGSASQPTYTFAGNSNTGLFSSGAGSLALAANGTAALYVDTSGYVGIGTSAPNAALDVNGTVRTSLVGLTNGGFQTGSLAASSLLLYDFSGNSASNPANVTLRTGRQGGPVVNGDGIGEILFQGNYNAYSQAVGAKITSAADGTVSASALPTRLSFFTTAQSSLTPNEVMRLTSSGQVGIGTTLPQAGLDIALTGTAASAVLLPRDTTANRPTAGVNGMLRYNTSNNAFEGFANNIWSTIAAGSAAGTVTNVAAGPGLLGGSITTAGTLSVDVGTAANKILQLNAGAQVPAVDGSLLTNVNAVQLQSRGVAATAPTNGQVLGWNQVSSQWQPLSASAGTLTNIATGTGLLGGPITTVGTLSVNVGTAANQIPQLNANAQVAPAWGTVAAPAYSFAGNLNTGVFSPGTASLSLVTNGTAALTVSNGYVGIGTASPYANVDVMPLGTYPAGNGVMRLNIVDGAAFGGQPILQLANSSTNVGAYSSLQFRSGSATSFVVSSSSASTTANLAFYTDVAGTRTRTMSLQGGMVGIGTATPQAGLDIATVGTTASALIVPRDSTANRPTTGVNGMIRYNSDNNVFEGFANNTWSTIAAGSAAGTVTNISAGTGLLGGPITTAGTLSVNVGTAANQIVQLNGSAQVAPALGTAAAPAYSFAGNTNTGVFSPAANKVALSLNGTAALTLDQTGANLVGRYQVAGSNALAVGNTNVVVGDTNAFNGTGGANTTMVGSGAGNALTTGVGNTGVGYLALSSNSTGGANTAVGWNALRQNNGDSNSAVGYWAFYGLSSGTKNNAVGRAAGYTLTSGSRNQAMGYYAMFWNSVGSDNVAIGDQALLNGTSSNNIAIGSNSGSNVTGGSANTIIGFNAGQNLTTGSNNIVIGANGTTASATGNSQLSIGNVISGDLSLGKIGINSATPVSALDVAGLGAISGMIVPRDTTANRPSGVNGMLRYNTTSGAFEGFAGGAWAILASGTSSGSLNSTAAVTLNSNSDGAGADGGFAFQANGTNLMTMGNGGDVNLSSNTSTTTIGLGALNSAGTITAASNIVAGGSVYGIGVNASGNFNNVYAASSSSLAGPTGASTGVNNVAVADGELATLSLLVRNSSANVQRAYVGAVANTGSSVYAPALVFGTQTGATAYAERMRIDQNGAVGIGTATPASALTVNGVIQSLTGGIKFPDGTTQTTAASGGTSLVVAPTMSTLVGGTSGAATNTSNGDLGNTVYGYKALNASTTGANNVAIGQYAMASTTSGGDNQAMGGQALQSNTTGSNNTAIGSRALTNGVTTYDDVAIGRNALTNATSNGGNVAIGRDAGLALTTGSNNVLIGYGAAYQTLTTGSNNILIGNAYGNVDAPAAGTSNFLDVGNVIFATGMTGSLASPAGQVGIGTASPSSKLTVYDSTTNAGIAPLVVAAYTGAGPGKYVNVVIDNQTSGAYKAGYGFRNNGTDKYGMVVDYLGNGSNNLSFYDSVAGQTRLLIDPSGNVGLGTVTPAYPLDVVGAINASTALRIAGTQICTSAGCTSSSDRTLKRDVQSLDDSLTKILGLNGVSYFWKDAAKFGAGRQVGLIAQDLEKVYPEVVVKDPRTGLRSVAYDHLVAPLIEAFKALYAKVSDDERRLSELAAENARLKANDERRAREMDELRQTVDALKTRLDRVEHAK